MLNIWTKKSGYSFGVIQERTRIDLALPVAQTIATYDSTILNFSVISGTLPPGLRIESDRIIGTAFEVPRDTEFKFVIRAKFNSLISDRTFFMTVSGADVPTWNTPAGPLPVGPNDAYYILDSSYIDFQLAVVDADTATGQSLKYFIPSNGGELPPGLILTETGRIVGWVQPTLAPPLTAGNGRFDTSVYDKVAYDFGLRSNNGYDTFVFDNLKYDFNIETLPPRKLNRNFEFNVIVTDGDSSAVRKFRIFVVGDDFFRADNTITTAGSGTFTADITYARAPIWTTNPDLGYFRANNYITFKLDTYEALVIGPVSYELSSINPDIYGMAFTNSVNENKSGKNLIRLKNVKGVPLEGHQIQLFEYVTGASLIIYTITNVQEISSTEYVLTINENLEKTIPNNTSLFFGTPSAIPPTMIFDPTTAEVFGRVPYQSPVTKMYTFTIKATRTTEKGETASAKRTFTVRLLGELDSTITWNTPADLGSIGANYISTLYISASTTYTESPLLYFLKNGQLPPGLSLNFDGEITGKVNQFGTEENPGLITLDEENLIFDGGDTTFDRTYNFTVEARDVLGYSAITRTFTLLVTTPNDRLYSNITARPFLKHVQRDSFKNFINDPDIFTINSVYRPTDSNFGIQKELKMLIYAGIETKSAAQFVSMVGRNHKPKRFKLGQVKKARANIPLTNHTVYEVVYVEVIDPLEIGKKYLPEILKLSENPKVITVDLSNQFYTGPFDEDNPYWNRPDPFNITIDRNDLFPGDPYTEYRFTSSLKIWRNRIKTLGLKDTTYLPLWMRTIQEGQVQPLGYVPAIPLCFCKPGTADDILLNIKFSGFEFSQLDYVIDRYIIDSVTGYTADKYIAFRNDRTTIT